MSAHAGAAAWFVALALILSYPLVGVLDTHVPGAGAGDNLAFLWNVWWARQVADTGTWSGYFHTGYLFAPYGYPLVLNTHTALESFAAAVVLHGLPVVRAHNLTLIVGLAANGFTAYLLAFAFVRRAMPSAVAGTSFAMCAYLSVHLLGHVNLTHAWVLPIAALGWVGFVRSPTPYRAGGTALALAAAAWSDYYYVVYATLFAAVWLAVSAWDVRVTWHAARYRAVERTLLAVAALAALVAVSIRLTSGVAFDIGGLHVSALHARNPTSIAGICVLLWAVVRSRVSATRAPDAPSCRPLLIHGSVALVLFVILTAPIIAAAVALVRSGGYVSQQYLWRSAPRGVDLATAVLGPPMHTLVGGWTSAHDRALGIDRVEQTAWLGIVITVLLIVAVRSSSTLGRDARRWLWVCAIFGVWSLGPSLTIGGADTGLLLPQAIARYIPVLSNARMPGRAIVMVQLASTVLGAIVLSRRAWTSPITTLVVGAIVLESLPAPFPLYRLPAADSIDARLSGSAAAVLELPTGLRDGFGEWGRFDSRALVHQMTHGRPLGGGFSARISPDVTAAYRGNRALAALVELSGGTIAADALPSDLAASLGASGILHVVVNTDTLGVPVREPFERRGLRFVTADGVRELYAVGR